MNNKLKLFSFTLISIVFLCSGCANIFDVILGTNDEQPSGELTEKYFKITQEDLKGWECGYTDGVNYIVGSHISDSDSTVFMISSEEKPNSICYFLFDEEKSLIGIGTEDNWISTFEGNGKIYLSWFNENNTICGDYFELNTQDSSSSQTKTVSSEILFDYNKISKITGVIGYMQNCENIKNHSIEKEYLLLAKDITSLITSLTLDILKAPAKLNLALFLGEMWIEGFVSTHNQRFQLAMYNECTTEITDISNDGNGNINVFVTIKNPDSVPSELVRLYYPTDEDITNNVYCGIVGREGVYPTSMVFTEPFKQEDLLERSWGKEKGIMYTFPNPNFNERHVFRSYLKSTRIVNDKGLVNNGYIKYSTPKNYINTGYIDQFKQESYTINDGYYIFKCTVHAIVESTNLDEWGIYLSNDELFPQKFYPKGYSEPSISSPNQAEFDVEIKLPIETFVHNSYEYVKLGIFSYDKKNNVTKWGNPQEFVIEILDPSTSISMHASEPKDIGNDTFSQTFDIACDKISNNYHLVVLNNKENHLKYIEKGTVLNSDSIVKHYDFSGSNLKNTISLEFEPIYDSHEYNPLYHYDIAFIPCIYDAQSNQYIVNEKPITEEIEFPAIASSYSFVGTLNGWDIDNSTMRFSHSGNSVYEDPVFSIGLVAEVWYDNEGKPHPIPIEFKVFPTKYNSWGFELGAKYFGVSQSDTDNIILEGKFTYQVTMNMKARTISW